MNDVLATFGAATREWFGAAFAAPTDAQAGAWRAIGAGHNALVVAPTGSGKTLAAFLWSLDRLTREPAPDDPRQRCRVLYVSPLKALAVDVERNLRTPLTGIRQAAARLGLPPPEITVGMRTGDTPADERRAFARTPPDILITTPESLFLLLTSAARDSLRGVQTVIVDEVHAVAGTKRGAHLALSLERLDALLPAPAQRIGLSATVRPIDATARFLGGARPVTVVQPETAKTIEVSVQVPVEDMTRLDEQEAPEDEFGTPRRASIWPAVEERVYDLVRSHRSTIVFTNSRRGAERLCARLNELAADEAELAADGAGLAADRAGWSSDPTGTVGGAAGRQRSAGRVGADRPGAPPRLPAEIMAQSGAASGAAPVIARAHHGSVSREERRHIEEALKSGQLPAVVATSSLELGIDMGAVDLVVQIEAPPSVAAGLQRVGRAGHQVGAVSRGVVFPKHRGDLLSCAVVAERMTDGAIEELNYPRNPLDVLAQQIVAMVALDEWRVADLTALIRRAAPFAELPDSALHAVLDMLSGRYPSTAFAELRPRLVWDRAADLLTGRPGAQRLAVTSGGTIPDRGLFGVFLAGAERAARVGELDEEMVYESRVGDVFLLGSSSWRIEDITPDRVLVSPRPGRRPGCRSGRATSSAARSSWAGRSATGCAAWSGPTTRRPGPRCAPAGWTTGPPATWWRTCASSRPRPARCRTTGRYWWSASATSWATGGWRCTACSAPGSTAPGHWPSPAGSPNATASTPRWSPPTTGSWSGCPTPPTIRPAPSWSPSTPTRSPPWWRSRSADPPSSPPGSGSVPPAPCCCPAATRAAASRSGSSASAPPNCSTSPGSTPTSRSRWRRPGSAYRTSSTCPAWWR
ncbi:hypothetical protein GCM10027615_33910 [Plantactinospora veratri]